MPKFSAQVDIKYSNNASAAARDVVTANNRMVRSSKQLGGAFTELGGIAKRGIQAGLVGIGAAMGMAVREGTKFETAIADLSAITGLTGNDLNYLSASALGMSKTYGIAGGSIAEATKLVASAKSELLDQPKALAAVTEQAIVLSKAARIELPSATKVLVESMNQFGLGADEANRAINVLAAGSKYGASEIAETGSAILKAGVAAKSVGLSFEQTNAALQVLAKNGLKAEIAGTQLKTALIALASSGIDEINPQVVGLSSALDTLAAANLDTEAAVNLFGREAFSAGKILIENRGLVDQWTTAITGTAIAQEQANINMSTFSEQAKRFGETIRVALIERFQEAEKPLSSIMTRLSGIITPLKDTGTEAKTSAGFWFELADGIDATIEGLQTFNQITGFTQKAFGTLDQVNEYLSGKLLGAVELFANDYYKEMKQANKAVTPEQRAGLAETLKKTKAFDSDFRQRIDDSRQLDSISNDKLMALAADLSRTVAARETAAVSVTVKAENGTSVTEAKTTGDIHLRTEQGITIPVNGGR